MMKILLTGATGLLGAQVLRLLIHGHYDVRALRRPSSRMDLVHAFADKVEWVEADITDIVALESAFEGITHVIHCAAMVSFHARDAHRMMQVNAVGTANLVNLSLDFGIQRFIHTSSIATLGRIKNGSRLDESSQWETNKSNSRYAVSKYTAEQEVWRGAAEGLNVAIINPSMIVGPGFWEENTSRFFHLIQNGMPFCPVGASGFVDVRDVAQFILLLFESNITEERFILNGDNLSYRDFFHEIAKELGVKPPAITVQPWLAEIAWRVEWLKEKLLGGTPMVTRESARSSISSFSYSNSKSLQAFPDFNYTPIRQTIQETAKAYKAHLLKSVK